MSTTHNPAGSLRVIPLLAIASLVLSACSLAAFTKADPTKAPTQLLVYTIASPPMSQVLDVAVATFKAQHPEVSFKIQPMRGDPMQELTSMTSGDNPPDIVWTIDSLTPAFVSAGLLLDMSELANGDKTLNLNDINPDALAAARVQNNPGLYVMPASFETVYLFYNKNLFQSSGAPLPAADWTWTDLIAACQQVQAAHHDVTCLNYSAAGLMGPDWWAYWVPWVRGYGGDVLSKDGSLSTLSSPQSMAGLQAYVDLWAKYQIATPPGNNRGNCFVNQKCAVTFLIPGIIKSYRDAIGATFEWDIQTMPAYPNGRFTGTATYGYGIAKTSKHPDVAWEFLRSIVSLDTQRAIATGRLGMPLLLSMANDPAVQQWSAPPANIGVLFSNNTSGLLPSAYPARCGSFYYGMVQSVMSHSIQDAIQGTTSLGDSLQAADTQIQACLDGN